MRRRTLNQKRSFVWFRLQPCPCFLSTPGQSLEISYRVVFTTSATRFPFGRRKKKKRRLSVCVRVQKRVGVCADFSFRQWKGQGQTLILQDIWKSLRLLNPISSKLTRRTTKQEHTIVIITPRRWSSIQTMSPLAARRVIVGLKENTNLFLTNRKN